MKDCIIKEIAIAKIKRIAPYCVMSEYGAGYAKGLKDAIDNLNTIPAAEVQPVKHGRWIKQEGFWNKNTVKCSLCGNYLDMNGVNGGRSDANYCPNCGAIMDLKDGDKND